MVATFETHGVVVQKCHSARVVRLVFFDEAAVAARVAARAAGDATDNDPTAIESSKSTTRRRAESGDEAAENTGKHSDQHVFDGDFVFYANQFFRVCWFELRDGWLCDGINHLQHTCNICIENNIDTVMWL